VTIQEPPKAPVDPLVAETTIALKEPSTAGHTQLLDEGDARVAGDAVSLSTPEPSGAPSTFPLAISPATISAILTATRKPKQESEWTLRNPWVTYGIVFSVVFSVLVFAFRKT
jgi:small neutral amino acid transporter SnatA (MarC family)